MIASALHSDDEHKEMWNKKRLSTSDSPVSLAAHNRLSTEIQLSSWAILMPAKPESLASGSLEVQVKLHRRVGRIHQSNSC